MAAAVAVVDEALQRALVLDGLEEGGGGERGRHFFTAVVSHAAA